MVHRIEQVGNEPIFNIYYENPFDFKTEPAEIGQKTVSTAQQFDEKQVGIHIVEDLQFSFKDVLDGVASTFDRNRPQVDEYGHIILVSEKPLAKLIIDTVNHMPGIKTPAYLVPTYEEALDLARKLITEPEMIRSD